MSYQLYRTQQNVVLRGTLQQDNWAFPRERTGIRQGMLFTPAWSRHREARVPRTELGAGSPAAMTPGSHIEYMVPELGYWSLQNRSGGAATAAIGAMLSNRAWVLGTWDASATNAEFVDDTTDAQDTDAGDVTHLAAIASDGFVVASKYKFDWISFEVSTADTGLPTYQADYSDAAGTGWTALTDPHTIGQHNWNIITTNGVAHAATGEAVLAWHPPHDWGRWDPGVAFGSAAARASIPEGYYAMRFTNSADAPGTAAAMTACEIGVFFDSAENVADNGILESPSHDMAAWHPDTIGIVAMFNRDLAGAATAIDAGNSVVFTARSRG